MDSTIQKKTALGSGRIIIAVSFKMEDIQFISKGTTEYSDLQKQFRSY